MQDKAFRLGVLNGVLFAVVMSAFQPDVILSAFFLKLTNSIFFATLPIAIMQLGGIWSQVIISNILEARERKKPYYVIAAIIRIALVAIMALSTYLLGHRQPKVLVLLIPVIYFVYSSGAGVCGIIFMDVIGKTIPANRRGRFMGLRGLFGGILGFLAGFYVRYLLSESGPAFPANYSFLFATAATFQIGALLAFAGIPEPVAFTRKERISFKEHLVQGMAILSEDRDFRLLFLIRVLNSIASIGGMVFIPYALKALGMHESIVGVLMVVSTCFALPSNLLWSHIGDKYGNRLLLLVATSIYLLVPVIAFASYYMPSLPLNFASLNSYNLRGVVFIIAFALSAATMNGRMMGDMNYFLEITPEARRPSYLAFMSVFLAPTSLVPLVGGIIAELISFQSTFILSFVFGLGAYTLIFRLNEPRKEK